MSDDNSPVLGLALIIAVLAVGLIVGIIIGALAVGAARWLS